MIFKSKLLICFLSLLAFSVVAKAGKLSDDDVKQSIINDSIASYPGNCPCPFNSAKNGSRCGRRSAWNRAGGYAPLCYKKEITNDKMQRWRESHNN